MKRVLSSCLVALCVLALAQPIVAQMGMGMRGPSVSGVWSPVVGSGAAYQMENKREGKREMEITIVSADTAEGKPGHWMEMSFKDEQGIMTVVRQLRAQNGKEMRVKIKSAVLTDNTFRIRRVIPENKREMDYDDFLRGIR